MRFTLLTTTNLNLRPQLQWLLYSERTGSFVFGDERNAFSIPVASPGSPAALPAVVADTGTAATHPCNLPVPRSLYGELAASPWHGFRFMDYSAYDHAVDDAGRPVGDMLRTLVFGPDHGHYVLHPGSGRVFGLRSASMRMLQREPDGFKELDRTRTRGGPALAFAAHPDDGLIAYGDNAGAFHAQRFDADGFGKASKVVARDRKASRLEFVRAGRMLVIGGLGYLDTFSYDAGKFAPLHQLATPVRDFIWLPDGERVLVNQGLHGVTAFGYGPDGFTRLGGTQPADPVQRMAVSTCTRYLAVSGQDSADISVFDISGG
jgi:hypothetical protein